MARRPFASSRQVLPHPHRERLQPKVRRVAVIKLPAVFRAPLVRNDEPPAVVQRAIRQPVRDAWLARTLGLCRILRLPPPRGQGQARLVLDLHDVRADQLLNVPMLRGLILLQVPGCLDAQVLAQHAAQLTLSPSALVSGVGTAHATSSRRRATRSSSISVTFARRVYTPTRNLSGTGIALRGSWVRSRITLPLLSA